jgi:hypothetical protein
VLQWIRQPTQLLDLIKLVAKPPAMRWRDATPSISDGRILILEANRLVIVKSVAISRPHHALCSPNTNLAMSIPKLAVPPSFIQTTLSLMEMVSFQVFRVQMRLLPILQRFLKHAPVGL